MEINNFDTGSSGRQEQEIQRGRPTAGSTETKEPQSDSPEYGVEKLIGRELEEGTDPDIVTREVATYVVGVRTRPDGSKDYSRAANYIPSPHEALAQRSQPESLPLLVNESARSLTEDIIQQYRAVGIEIVDGQPNFEGNREIRTVLERTERLYDSGMDPEEAQKQTAVLWDNLARRNPQLIATVARYSGFSRDTYAGSAVEAYNRSIRNKDSSEIIVPHKSIDGVTALENTLATRYPGMTEPQRLSEWLREQRTTLTPLDLGTEAPGTYKDVYTQEDTPDIVIKRFRSTNKSAEDVQRDFQAEQAEFASLHQFVGDEFLPATKFITVEDPIGRHTKEFYVLQERLHGLRYKSVGVEAAMESFRIGETQGEAAYLKSGGEEGKFMGFVSEVLARKFTPESWAQLQVKARALVGGLEKLESGDLRLRDIDFFLTDSGDIKISDYKVINKATIDDPRPDDEIKGLEEIKTLFNV